MRCISAPIVTAKVAHALDQFTRTRDRVRLRRVAETTRVNAARLTIGCLQAFVVAAEELNFRRAADRLYIASSPLSRRIKDLEAAVGALLFERDTRNVRLTAEGEALLPLARDVLARLDALTSAVRV